MSSKSRKSTSSVWQLVGGKSGKTVLNPAFLDVFDRSVASFKTMLEQIWMNPNNTPKRWRKLALHLNLLSRALFENFDRLFLITRPIVRGVSVDQNGLK